MQLYKHCFVHIQIKLNKKIIQNEILACACLDTSGVASLARQAHASKQKRTNFLHKVNCKQTTKFILARMQQNGI